MSYPTYGIPSVNPQNFTISTPVGIQLMNRDPTAQDNTFPPGWEWQNTLTTNFFKCVRAETIAGATWVPFVPAGTGLVSTLTGNSGGLVGPNGGGNITIVGDGTTANVVGNSGTNTMTISLVGGLQAIGRINTDVAGPVLPNAGSQIFENASTSTYTDGTVANTLKTEVQGVNHALFIGRGAHVPATTLPAATNGQIPIGSTGVDPVVSTITAGAGITVTNGAGSITIASSAVVGSSITGNSGGPLAPVLGNWNIFGAVTAAGSTPVTAAGAGNTLTLDVQTSQAIAATDATKIGLAAFNNVQFTVDANGFVSQKNGLSPSTFPVQAATAPGTNPVVPSAAGALTINGTAVASAGIPVRSDSIAANTIQIEVQRASQQAVSAAANAGLASFNNLDFTVDANGFVTLVGGATADNFTVDASTAPGTNPVLPSGGGNIVVHGTSVAAAGIPVQTNSIAPNAYQIEVQRASAAVGTVLGNAGLASFNNAQFTVDGNGFVSIIGGAGISQINGDSGSISGATVAIFANNATQNAGSSVQFTNAATVSTFNVTDANSNTILGKAAGNATLTSTNVAAFGAGSVRALTSGSSISALGLGALKNVTSGSNLIGIGLNAGSAYTTESSNIVIGSAGVVADANTIRIGTQGAGAGQQNKAFIAGITGAVPVGANAPQVTLTDNAGNLAVITSGVAGLILTSNGVGATPTFQTASASGAITTITGNSGGAEVPLTGNFNVLGTGSITVAGSANTETIQLTGLTNHNVLVGAGTATITNVPPSATAGIPLISNGAAADPSFGTAVVAGGGTGNTTFTAYSVITAGTTATNPFQNVSGVGTAAQVLTSTGAGALPTWQDIFTTGTWTPALNFGGAATGITYGTQNGYYTKIGNMVYVYAVISLTSKGSSTGSATITGLPFTVSAQANYNPIGIFSEYINFSVAGFIMTNIQFVGGATNMILTASSTSTSSNLADTNFANNTGFYISGFYQV